MLDQLIRYISIIEFVKKERYRKILEVGCGITGLNVYLSDPFIVGVDIKFACVKNSFPGHFHPIIGSAELLPFKDNSFPAVVCVDALEHVTPKDRENAIRELWRVTNGRVYLAFPTDEASSKLELVLLKSLKFFKKDIPDWLIEHIEKKLPEEKSVARFLKENNIDFKIISNENNIVHFLIVMGELSWLGKYLNYISDIISSEKWERKEHGFKGNLIRAFSVYIKTVFLLLNFGSTVRKIFILTKN